MNPSSLKKYLSCGLNAAAVAGILAGAIPQGAKGQDNEAPLLAGGYASQSDIKVASQDEALGYLVMLINTVEASQAPVSYRRCPANKLADVVGGQLDGFLDEYVERIAKADGRELSRSQAVKVLAKKLGISMETWRNSNMEINDDMVLCLLMLHDYKYAPLIPEGDKKSLAVKAGVSLLITPEGEDFPGYRSATHKKNWFGAWTGEAVRVEGREAKKPRVEQDDETGPFPSDFLDFENDSDKIKRDAGVEIAPFEFSDAVDIMGSYARLPEKLRVELFKYQKGKVSFYCKAFMEEIAKGQGREVEELEDAEMLRRSKNVFLDRKGISAKERLKYFKTDLSIDLGVIGVMDSEIIERVCAKKTSNSITRGIQDRANRGIIMARLMDRDLAEDVVPLQAMIGLEGDDWRQMDEVVRAYAVAGLTQEGVMGEVPEKAMAAAALEWAKEAVAREDAYALENPEISQSNNLPEVPKTAAEIEKERDVRVKEAASERLAEVIKKNIDGYVERLMEKNSVSPDEAEEYLFSWTSVDMFVVAVADPAVVAAMPQPMQEKMAALKQIVPVAKIKRMIVEEPVM